MSPDGQSKNQIDFILMSQSYRNSVKNANSDLVQTVDSTIIDSDRVKEYQGGTERLDWRLT